MITERMQELAGLSLKESSSDNEAAMNAYLDELWQKTYPHPFTRGVRVFKNKATIEPAIFDERIHLSAIMTLGEEKQGVGTEVMKFLTKLADKHNVNMSLDPKPFGTKTTITKAKLISFYKRFGFKMGKYGSMHRDIRKSEAIKLTGKMREVEI